jgi:hypothetical protein
MVSEENVEFLREKGQRYILGTPRSQLRRFERELLDDGWEMIREGLEVKLCPCPDGDETFIPLTGVRKRRRCTNGLRSGSKPVLRRSWMCAGDTIANRRLSSGGLAVSWGSTAPSIGAGLFKVNVKDVGGRAEVVWSKVDAWREWSNLSEGCYLLRSNITDWSAEELWKAYIQLTQAEAAFRITKSDLLIRPIWHQRKERVGAHILVCFLAYVIWKALGQLCQKAGLGDEPRKIFPEGRGTNPDGGCGAADAYRRQYPPQVRCAADKTPGDSTTETRTYAADASKFHEM